MLLGCFYINIICSCINTNINTTSVTNHDKGLGQEVISVDKYLDCIIEEIPVNNTNSNTPTHTQCLEKNLATTEINQPVTNQKSVFPCYQLYYLNMLKCHILVNKVLEDKQIWDCLDNEQKSKIDELLIFRHTLDKIQTITSFMQLPVEFVALFRPIYSTNLDHKIKDHFSAQYLNKSMIYQLKRYAIKNNYLCGTERLYKIVYNFLLNELITKLNIESQLNLTFNQPRSIKDTDVELMISAYAFFYIINGRNKISKTNVMFKKYIETIYYGNNKDIVLSCRICNQRLYTNTFIHDADILHFLYCPNHKEVNRISFLFRQSNKNIQYKEITKELMQKLNLLYCNSNAENTSDKSESTKNIIYYKKMADLARHLIEEECERSKIVERLQNVFARMPNLYNQPNDLLQGILEFELQHTERYKKATDDTNEVPVLTIGFDTENTVNSRRKRRKVEDNSVHNLMKKLDICLKIMENIK